MKIGIIQNTIMPETRQNLERVKKLAALSKEADILLLPELWNTPYDNQKILSSLDSFEEAFALLKDISRENHCILVGGTLAERQGSSVYNTSFVFQDGSLLGAYRKMHLMEFYGRNSYTEKEIFTPGNQMFTLQSPWGKLGIAICYDLRFPELPRLLAKHQVRLLLVPAAFNTHVGQEHWHALLKTRAMENQIFIAAANPAQYTFATYTAYGHSLIVNPFGTILNEAGEHEEVLSGEIDMATLQTIRQRSPFWKIRRDDLYEVIEYDPDNE